MRERSYGSFYSPREMGSQLELQSELPKRVIVKIMVKIE